MLSGRLVSSSVFLFFGQFLGLVLGLLMSLCPSEVASFPRLLSFLLMPGICVKGLLYNLHALSKSFLFFDLFFIPYIGPIAFSAIEVCTSCTVSFYYFLMFILFIIPIFSISRFFHHFVSEFFFVTAINDIEISNSSAVIASKLHYFFCSFDLIKMLLVIHSRFVFSRRSFFRS